MPQKSELRQYMEKHPTASVEGLIEKFVGVTKQQVYQIRNALKKPIFTAEPVLGQVQIAVTIPESGLVVKLVGEGILGTLEITSEGLSFTKSNGKKKPERQLSWKFLESVQSLEM